VNLIRFASDHYDRELHIFLKPLLLDLHYRRHRIIQILFVTVLYVEYLMKNREKLILEMSGVIFTLRLGCQQLTFLSAINEHQLGKQKCKESSYELYVV
jgi:hypothetical protein